MLKVDNVKDTTLASNALKTAVGSHLYGFQDLLAPRISEACIQVTPKVATNFNVDNVRVAKIVGGGVSDTEVVKGFVLARGAEGTLSFCSHFFCSSNINRKSFFFLFLLFYRNCEARQKC